MDPDWHPTTREELADRLQVETAKLSASSAARFARYRVEPWQAIYRVSDQYGDERVWVVAQSGRVAVFLHDDEDEFAIGVLSDEHRLMDIGLYGDLTDALSNFPECPDGRSAG
jgi:hypothetical protein